MPDTYTPNLKLKKPGYDSPADIEDINANMDKIDAHASQLSQQIGDEWTAWKTYAVGDYAINGYRLYKCKVAHTAGNAFEPSYFTPMNVSEELHQLSIKTAGFDPQYFNDSRYGTLSIHRIGNGMSIAKFNGIGAATDGHVEMEFSVPEYLWPRSSYGSARFVVISGIDLGVGYVEIQTDGKVFANLPSKYCFGQFVYMLNNF